MITLFLPQKNLKKKKHPFNILLLCDEFGFIDQTTQTHHPPFWLKPMITSHLPHCAETGKMRRRQIEYQITEMSNSLLANDTITK